MPSRSVRPVGEIVWLQEKLRALSNSAPMGDWGWGTCSPNWDFQEFLENMREEATKDASAISRAIRLQQKAGRWPKISKRAAYFLHARIAAALWLCSSWMHTHNPSGNAADPVRPSDSEQLVQQVLTEYWESKGVDAWLEENKSSFQEPERNW